MPTNYSTIRTPLTTASWKSRPPISQRARVSPKAAVKAISVWAECRCLFLPRCITYRLSPISRTRRTSAWTWTPAQSNLRKARSTANPRKPQLSGHSFTTCPSARVAPSCCPKSPITPRSSPKLRKMRSKAKNGWVWKWEPLFFIKSTCEWKRSPHYWLIFRLLTKSNKSTESAYNLSKRTLSTSFSNLFCLLDPKLRNNNNYVNCLSSSTMEMCLENRSKYCMWFINSKYLVLITIGLRSGKWIESIFNFWLAWC